MQSENERRNQPMRRQANEAFLGADGKVSLSKLVATFSQITVLYWTGKTFDTLIQHTEAFLICLTFLIVPDVFKKLLAMKYGK